MPIGIFRLNGLARAIAGTTPPPGGGGGGNVYDGTFLQYIANPNYFDTPQTDLMGNRVAMTADYIVAGARTEDYTLSQTSSGVVYVWDANDYTLLYSLVNPNNDGTWISDSFGEEVAVYGDRLYASAPGEDHLSTNDGVVYVFDLTDGSLINTISRPTAMASAYFSRAMACGETYTVIGDQSYNPGSDAYSGASHVYDTLTGNFLFTLINPNVYDTPYADYFGYSVAVSGNIAVVGAPYEDSAASTYSGAAYIYDLSTQTLLHSIPCPNEEEVDASDYFGYSVATNGTKAIVGAYNGDGEVSSSGYAYVIDVATGTVDFGVFARDISTTAGAWHFGYDVGIDSNRFIVSTLSEPDASGNSSVGSVYLFDLVTGQPLASIPFPNGSGQSPVNVQFGNSIAMAGGKIVAGAPREAYDATYTLSGAIYVFD